MRLYLVRHGQTTMNIEGKTLGQMDVDLDAEGKRQLPLLERRFLGLRLGRILSSDLKRAQLTAEAIARSTNTPITLTPELRERSFGEWEGRDYAEVNKELLQMSREQKVPLYETKPPCGESHHDVWDRTQTLMESMFKEEQDVAIVSHGGACRVMLSQLLRATLATTFCFKFDNTSVTTLDRRPDGAFLMSLYNDTRHVTVPSEAEHIFRGTS